jgi:hypothetical protein
VITSSLLALVLLACGGDKDTPPDGPPPEETGDTGTTTSDEWSDPLSAPLVPTAELGLFTSAQDCETCHADHYDQWSQSMHAYSMTDPVYRALVDQRQADLGGMEDRFCLQCHTPIGSRTGDITSGFDFGGLDPISLEGITCESCHKVSHIERPYNAGLVLDPDGPIRGPIPDDELVLDNTPFPGHQTTAAEDNSAIFDQSELCGSCHDVIETDGLDLERPYQEWLESPAYEAGKPCQACHMAEYTGKAVTQGAGGMPDRTLHDHTWIGVDVPLEDGFLSVEEEEAKRASVQALLADSGTVVLEAPDEVTVGETFDLVVTIYNNIDGHNLPTGTTFIRQLWVEVIARDGSGQVLYETGTLDANGDLKDYFSELERYADDDLINFGSTLVGFDGTPQLFSWRSAEHTLDSIPPLLDRTFTLFIPTDQVASPGPVSIEARLRFRSHAPYLLRALGLPEKVEKLQIYDIDATTLDVGLLPP